MKKKTAYTIKNLLELAAEYFDKAEIESPRRNAEYVLSSVLGLNRMDLFLKYDLVVNDPERVQFRCLAGRIQKGEPWQYVIGHTSFMGLEIDVVPGVLIPRPETEELVGHVLDIVKKNKRQNINILDMCTGSGNMIIAFAHFFLNRAESSPSQTTKNLPGLQMFAVDQSLKALEIAKKNAAKFPFKDSIQFFQGDLFSCLEENNLAGKMDIIMSNPPYVPSEVLKNLPVRVKNYEPREALDGGADGLDYYKRIIPEAHRFLRSRAFLALELGEHMMEPIQAIFHQAGVYDNIEFIKDDAGRIRFAFAQKR